MSHATESQFANFSSNEKPNGEKPCRSCTDFKSWMAMHSKSGGGQNKKGDRMDESKNLKGKETVIENTEHMRSDCPVDIEQLGKCSWAFLHTMASHYPDKPSLQQRSEMSQFITLFSKFYPCNHCAEDFQQSVKKNPPQTNSRYDLSQWMCRQHNEVNVKLGKPEFDCKLVDERWLFGWKDGSCG